MSYRLIDSGNGLKLEQFGEFLLIRPSAQSLWSPQNPAVWKHAHGAFSREKGWHFASTIPESWIVELEGVRFKVSPTDFGHLGLFPEHAQLWKKLQLRIEKRERILNLFAYSGAATLALAQKGAQVCHLDAAKGMVQWARENAQLNHLGQAPIRWIVDDVLKFLKREKKRGSFYEGIILDPPTFGRGSKGELFKIERDLSELLNLCKEILSKEASFVTLSCHTPGITPLVLSQVMKQIFEEECEVGELFLTSQEGFSIPSGCYGICWFKK